MKKILIIIGIVAIIAAAIASMQGMLGSPTSEGSRTSQDSVALTAEEQKELEIDKQAVVSVAKAARYTHPRLGFSFEKPEGYTVGSIKGDDGSETIIVQPSSGSPTSQRGFQIFINPIDEPLTLSPNLIKSDLPGTSVNSPQAIELDGKGKGMMFSSNNDAFGGSSYEIWFVYPNVAGGNVYQVSSYGEFATQLQQIIGTWKFN